MMDNACVIGYGVVGRATAEALGIKKYYSRSSSNITLEEASKCRFIFICLPTLVENGEYVTKDIESIVKQLNTDNIIVLRSTVNPGFTKSLQERLGVKIAFCPEFLSEDTAVEDAKNPDLIVVGSDDASVARAVAGVFSGRFKYNPMIVTNSVTAEFIKIGLNGFFTTKVMFANQMYDYAHNVGANYEIFKTALQSHRWGSKNHFDIFHKGGRGAGGKCLRKDMEALAHYSTEPLFYAVNMINQRLLEESDKQ